MEVVGSVVAVAEIGTFIAALIRLVEGVRTELKNSPMRTQERVVDLSQLSSTLRLFHEVILDPGSLSTAAETVKDVLHVIHRRLDDLSNYLQFVAARTDKPLLHRVYYAAFRGATAEQEVAEKLAALEANKTTLVLHVSLCMAKTLSQVHEVILRSALTTSESQTDNNETVQMPLTKLFRRNKKHSSFGVSLASDSGVSPPVFRRSTDTARSDSTSTTMPPPRDYPDGRFSRPTRNAVTRYNGTMTHHGPSPRQTNEYFHQHGYPTMGHTHQCSTTCECQIDPVISAAIAEGIRSAEYKTHKSKQNFKHMGNSYTMVEGAPVPTHAKKTYAVTYSETVIGQLGDNFWITERKNN